MTKKEFDAETKWNYGTHMGARTAYRISRGHVVSGYDYLRFRALVHARVNAARFSYEGFLPLLARGSQFRAPQAWRAAQGRSLLRLGGEP